MNTNMSANGTQKLAQLPGYDTAPDVYETGDANDDDTTTSTQQTHSQVPSEASNTSDEEEDGEEDGYGVSRRRLYPQRARSRFGEQSRGVVTKGADLSDRVDGKRKGYRIRSRPRDVDVDESLEARIARLRQEIEECKVEAQAEKAANGDEEEDEEEEGDALDDCDTLSKLLAGIDISSSKRKGHRRRASIFHDAPTTAPPIAVAAARDDTTDEEHTLAKVSAFDSRLAALESALGITSLDSLTESQHTTPILPTLTLLDHQLATLTSATNLSSLEQVSSRISKLKLEARNLSQLQQQQSIAQSDSEDAEQEESPPTLLSPDDMTQLQTLYTLIPNLQTLAPTVPALMTRLRSLRELHTTAANVSADLENLEQRQSEMDKELKMWREGLEKVEKAVRDEAEANGRNGNFVKGWVEDLEKRMKVLR